MGIKPPSPARSTLAAFAVAIAVSSGAAASTPQPTPSGPQTYSGLATAVGSGGCSAVTGSFPSTVSFNYVPSPGQNSFFLFQAGISYLKILIQNPAQGLAPQFINVVLYPDLTYAAYDASLFGTFTGVAGSYNTPSALPYESTEFASAPGITYTSNIPVVALDSLTLISTIPGTSQTCKIVLNGILYLD